MNRLEDYDCITENEKAVKDMDWWAGRLARWRWRLPKNVVCWMRRKANV
mgnify:CR=1 FL=1